MRWGVRDEATDDHMTTELCMKEIENCQRLSMGPNFVVFLGQKYGYRPIPTYILSSELQIIRDELTSMGVDATLLDTWYKKDSNAVPPISVLQPISSILVNFNNKVINEWIFVLAMNWNEVINFFLISEYLNCKQRTRPSGGTHWVKCKNYFGKQQPLFMHRKNSKKILCTTILCLVRRTGVTDDKPKKFMLQFHLQ